MKTKQIINSILACFLVTALLVSFQNCGGKLQSSSLSSDGTVDGSSAGGGGDHSAPHIAPVSSSFKPYSPMEFKVNQDVPIASPTYSWSHTLDGVPAACTVAGGNTSSNYIVTCQNNGSLVVKVTVKSAGTPVPMPNFNVTVNGSVIAPPQGLSASFRVPAGTGTQPWNSSSTPIEVYVGQTLTITNDDTIAHQMHTGGNPCAHGSSFAAGASTTCVISSAVNTVTGTNSVYDHIVGSSARIYIVAHNGQALYETYCAGCHMTFASSTKKMATYQEIMLARQNNSTMLGNSGVQGLSAKQIEAIAYALSK